MTRQMAVVRWVGGQLERQHVEVDPGAKVLPVRYAGVCSSEEALAPDHGIGLGHELVVEHAGALHVLAPFVSCGACEQCRNGFLGRCTRTPCPSLSWSDHGGMGGEVVLRDPRLLIPVPRSTEHAYLYPIAEPLAAGISAVAETSEAAHVLVVGFGAVGIGAALARAAAGSPTSVVVRHEWQKALAQRIGVAVVDGRRFGAEAPRHVVVAAPSIEAVEVAADLIAPGGEIHVVAMNTADATWRAATGGRYDFFRKELAVHYHYMYTLDELRKAVGLVQRFEKLLLDAIVGPLRLGDAGRAVRNRRDGRRVVVDCRHHEHASLPGFVCR